MIDTVFSENSFCDTLDILIELISPTVVYKKIHLSKVII